MDNALIVALQEITEHPRWLWDMQKHAIRHRLQNWELSSTEVNIVIKKAKAIYDLILAISATLPSG